MFLKLFEWVSILRTLILFEHFYIYTTNTQKYSVVVLLSDLIPFSETICGAHLASPHPPFLFCSINFLSHFSSSLYEVFPLGKRWLKAISWLISLFAALKALPILSDRKLYSLYTVRDQSSCETFINQAGGLINFGLFTCSATGPDAPQFIFY